MHFEGRTLPKPIVLVGTSFLNAIFEVLASSGIAPSVVELSYLTSARRCMTCGWEKATDHWAQTLIEDSSALIVEINESASFGGNQIGYLTTLFDRLLTILEKSEIASPER